MKMNKITSLDFLFPNNEKELGEENRKQDEVDAYLEKLATLNLRNTTLKKIEAEIHKYECMNEILSK